MIGKQMSSEDRIKYNVVKWWVLSYAEKKLSPRFCNKNVSTVAKTTEDCNCGCKRQRDG